MIVAHDPDCPALCQPGWDDCPHPLKDDGTEHACTCTAQAALAELIAAAIIALDGRTSGRLYAALKPFREENKEK